jgi:hypothetical protein
LLCLGDRISISILLLSVACPASGFAQPQARTYYVDCNDSARPSNSSLAEPLHSLKDVNALTLHGGETVLFKRGSTCDGALRMQGSGRDSQPIRVGAYGDGALPHIKAGSSDEAVIQLINQEYWEISSLEIDGGKKYGVFITSDSGTLHHIYLRDLRVHDTRGQLKQKESGLVVITSTGKDASIEDVDVDGISAWDTTQWGGIFISGASLEKPMRHIRVKNSIVHDVQGDGIILFNVADGVIARSAAWHTGMQHVESIGTPNAIWTWHCVDCVVEQNEAFLTDSPGVDGGAFDIDYGNTRNTVRENFGHDTQGYCVSVFGASGPTVASLVADNLCLNNGMSPRLAQRQGAILLMTWQDGSIDGVEIRGNRVDWQAAGDAPAVQTGSDLRARGVALRNNEIWSTGSTFVDAGLNYKGEKNLYVLADRNPASLNVARQRFETLPEQSSSLKEAPAQGEKSAFGVVTTNTEGWKLIATIPSAMFRSAGSPELRGVLVELKSAALQFGHSGLQVIFVSDGSAKQLLDDWQLREDGIQIQESAAANAGFSIKLISPAGTIFTNWAAYPGPTTLGLALRQSVGEPSFGQLHLAQVKATD